MSNYIQENRQALSEYHYIRQARESDFWFDFTHKKVESYRDKYNGDFCLVLYNPGEINSAYIMPYKNVATFFSQEQADPNRARWTGEIRNDIMRLRPGNVTMSVSAYYNSFNLLHTTDEIEDGILHDAEVLYDVAVEIGQRDLIGMIQEINRRYREAIPYKRIVLSEQVARPGAIADYIKRMHNFACQICDTPGFMQKNGNLYAETHHLTELHELLPGSYCSDNIIVVCPTCHSKLHYANVAYLALAGNRVSVEINGQKYDFLRNVISND